MIEYRKVDVELISDAESRTIEGYGAVFNSESADLGFIEIIEPSAITEETIRKSDVFATLNHDQNKVLARSKYGDGTLKLNVDERGLHYVFEAADTALGNEVLEHIKRGEIDSSSFAFTVDKTDENAQVWERREDGTIYRTIKKIDRLYDVAAVFSPAYPAASCSMRNKKEDYAEELKQFEERAETPVEERKDEEISDEVFEVKSEENKEINTEKRKMNKKEFSILNAIRTAVEGRSFDEATQAVINEGKTAMRNAGLAVEGQIAIPTEQRAITVATEGDDTVEVEMQSLLKPLRAKNVLVQAGAKVISGLQGDIQFPILNAGNVTFEGETAPAKDAGYTFDSKKLSPTRLTAYVDLSRQFLIQNSVDAENALMEDLLNAISAKIEAVLLGDEAGTSTKPEGIFYTTGSVASVSDFADLANLEADVDDANVFGEKKYIMSNKAKAALRTMIKGTNGTGMVMEGNSVDGTEAFNTSHVSGKRIAYGDWSNLVIGVWDGISIITDPYTLAASGQVRLVVNFYVNAILLRPEAIAVAEIA